MYLHIYIYSVWLHGRYPTVGICLRCPLMKAMMKANRHRVPYRLAPGGRTSARTARQLAPEGCITYSVQAVVAILMVLSFPFMAIWFSCIKPLADGFEDWWKRKYKCPTRTKDTVSATEDSTQALFYCGSADQPLALDEFAVVIDYFKVSPTADQRPVQ